MGKRLIDEVEGTFECFIINWFHLDRVSRRPFFSSSSTLPRMT